RADDLGGRPRRVGVRQLHAGQRVHPVHLAVGQRGPAELPGTARSGGVVEDHEVTVRLKTRAPQVIGAGQSGLTSAYDDDVDVAYPGVVHVSTNRPGAADLPCVPWALAEPWCGPVGAPW